MQERTVPTCVCKKEPSLLAFLDVWGDGTFYVHRLVSEVAFLEFAILLSTMHDP